MMVKVVGMVLVKAKFYDGGSDGGMMVLVFMSVVKVMLLELLTV